MVWGEDKGGLAKSEAIKFRTTIKEQVLCTPKRMADELYALTEDLLYEKVEKLLNDYDTIRVMESLIRLFDGRFFMFIIIFLNNFQKYHILILV